MHPTHRTRVFRTLLPLALAAAVLLPAATVTAQGTSGTLPGPINSRQLMQYADMLGLSDSQRLVMESVHDDYRTRFRTLRDGEIASFLRDQQSMQGGIPQRAAVEKILEEQKQALREQPFTYDPGGRRDPFQSLAEAVKEAEGPRPAGIAGMSVDQLEVHSRLIQVDRDVVKQMLLVHHLAQGSPNALLEVLPALLLECQDKQVELLLQ